MKRILIFAVLCCLTLNMHAQANARYMYADSLIPRFCVDINAKGGLMTANMTTVNFADPYKTDFTSSTVLNDTIKGLNFAHGLSYALR